MKNNYNLKNLAVMALLSLSSLAAGQSNSDLSIKLQPVSESKTLSQESSLTSGKKAHPSGPYTAYDIDGRTSASVLAAKRSHTVSKQDENGLAIFSGFFVICLIVFFTQAFSKKK